jgi:hypothetical protein
VFAIDGQDRDVARAGCGSKDFPGGNHAFLVGQADGLSGEDCGVGCFQSGDADNGGNNKVCLGQRSASDCTFGAVDHSDAGDARPAQPQSQCRRKLVCRQGDELGTPPDYLREGFVEVAAYGKRRYFEAVGELLNDRKGALPNGARGTENGESLHDFAKSSDFVETV